MAKRKHRFLAVAFGTLSAISLTEASARNHVSNCLTDESYQWHETHFSLVYFVKADESTGMVDLYSKPDLAHQYPQGKGPWLQVNVQEMVSFEDHQFLGGNASDYNGNLVHLRLQNANGEAVFQENIYILATDAECELKPTGYFSPSEELKPSELCRIKNK